MYINKKFNNLLDNSYKDSSNELSKNNYNKSNIAGENKDFKNIPKIKTTTQNYIINEDNYSYQLPFKFSDKEIEDVFKTLDIKNQGFITKEELSFFLEILGTEFTEEEVEEMVRIADIEGTEKVYFDEFKKLAKGKLISPIGLAFPIEYKYLDNANINNISGDQIRFIKKENDKLDQLDFINNSSSGNIGTKINKSDFSNLKVKSSNYKENYNKKRKEVTEIFFDVIKDTDQKQIFKKYKKITRKEIKKCDYKNFIYIFDLEENEESKVHFDDLAIGNTIFMDLRELLINYIGYKNPSNWVKNSNDAFDIMDIEFSGNIQFKEFLKLISWLLIEYYPNERKEISLKNIYNHMNISDHNSISKQDFITIIKNNKSLLSTKS